MPENGPGEPTSPYHRQWNTTMSNGQQAQQPPPQHSFTMTATTTGSNGDARRQVQIVGTFLPNSNRHSNGRTPPVIHRQISNISMPNDKSGLFGSISNMVNSIVGAGIIGIPYAISNSGFLLGILLLVLVSYMTDRTLRIMVNMATYHPKLRYYGVRTYEDLAQIPFGRTGCLLVLTGMLVMAYGAMLAYLLIIKDTIPSILGLTSEAGKGNFRQAELPMLLTSLVVIVPLSMMRDMANLEKTSLLSVLADTTLVGFMVLNAPIKETVSESGGFGQVLEDNAVNSRVFIGLGVLSTAMACQHCAFIVSNSLQDLTPDRWSTVTGRSLSISATLCLILGVCGYLGFLEETQGNILNNFDADSIVVNVGRGLLAITMFFTYPMEAFVARHVLVELCFNGDMDGKDYNTSFWAKYFGRRQKLTMAIYIATLIPALLLDDLGPVLSLTGAVGASFLSYIGTGVIYFGVNGDDFLQLCLTMLTKRQAGREQVATSEDTSVVYNGPEEGLTHGTTSHASAHSQEQPQGCGETADILTHCQQRLNDHQLQVDQQRQTKLLPLEVELPNVRPSATTARSSCSTVDPLVTTEEALSRIRKPFWWYLFLYPLWCKIASIGAKGTREFLGEYTTTTAELVSETGPGEASRVEAPTTTPAENDSAQSVASWNGGNGGLDEEEIVNGPSLDDYYFCMFSITFGILACVVGVASNVYVEVDKMITQS